MKIHIVQRGDTLWSIAEKYQVSFEEVKKMNAHLANPDMIVPGMKIKLPDTAMTTAAPMPAMPLEKDHPYAEKKPFACPPQMEEVKEMEEVEQQEFTMPENWMTEPVPAPQHMDQHMEPYMEHHMMMPCPPIPCPPVPCYFFPVPYPMPYMRHMMPESEAQEEMEHPDMMPDMMPRCPYCHR